MPLLITEFQERQQLFDAKTLDFQFVLPFCAHVSIPLCTSTKTNPGGGPKRDTSVTAFTS